MKKTCFFFFPIYLILLSFFPLSSNAQNSVMTYNIRYDNPKDSVNCWNNRKEELTKMIAFYQPDILGTQEGLHHQITYLNTQLKNYKYLGVGRNDGKNKGEYAAIFYNQKKLKPVEWKTYWLSETPNNISVGWDASMERIVTYAHFKNLKTNTSIYVYNAHFDHRGELARKKSAELITNLIKSQNILNKQIIVMGDFNSLPNEKPIETFSKILDDSYNTKPTTTYGPKGTFNQFSTTKPATYRIDYIFTKNLTTTHYIHVDDRRNNNLQLSDHYPVLIKIAN